MLQSVLESEHWVSSKIQHTMQVLSEKQQKFWSPLRKLSFCSFHIIEAQLFCMTAQCHTGSDS